MGILINTKSVEAVYRGNNEVSAIYVGSDKVWPETKEYILFLDPEVERICVQEYGDGIGCTIEDLNNAATLYNFAGNTVIEYFPEFKYFTSITNAQLAGKFNNCTNLKSIEIPNQITELLPSFTGTFLRCTSLNNVVLSPNLTYIGQNAFRQCSSLQTLNIPDTVTRIGNNAFDSSSIDLQLPPYLQEIGYAAMYGTRVSAIQIPKTTTFIGAECFRYCSLLSSVTFESGGTSDLRTGNSNIYSGGLFAQCPNLAEVRFPVRLSSLGNRCLSIALNGSNKSIRYVFERTTPPTVPGELFNGGIQQATMYVPDEALEDYKAATGFSTYASSIFPISQLPTT